MVSNDNTDTPSLQIVVGNEVRNANRDYYENVTIELPSNWHLLDDKIRDAYSLRSDAAFQERFGFSLPPEGRQDVIDIRKHGRLTDSSIRYLRRTGVLDIRGGRAQLRPSVLIEGWGWTTSLLFAVIAVCILFAGHQTTPSLGMIGGHVLVDFLYWGVGGLCIYSLAFPQRVGREAQRMLLQHKEAAKLNEGVL